MGFSLVDVNYSRETSTFHFYDQTTDVDSDTANAWLGYFHYLVRPRRPPPRILQHTLLFLTRKHASRHARREDVGEITDSRKLKTCASRELVISILFTFHRRSVGTTANPISNLLY